MSSSQKPKLSYFNAPGRAEQIRLAFWIGKIEFEDVRVEFKDWKETLKAKSPWDGMPILELPSGEVIGQCRTIARYVAKKVGLYPSNNDILAARIDEILDAMEDFMSGVNKVGQGLPKDDKLKARKEGMTSGFPARLLKKLDAFIAANGSNGFVVGDKLTQADLAVFAYTTFVTSGFYDGVSADCLKPYANIQAVRKTVATIPQVIARYKAETSGYKYYQAMSSVAASL